MLQVGIDFRNATLCALLTIMACMVTWPFADIPFNDDWSYAFTVKRLVETGHLIYNGWSSPSLISQAYWGCLWVKLFGFSFDVLRFSTILLAAGSSGITYLLARRAGLLTRASIFSALLLSCSPLFLPLATSFMTDVPGCFCLLLSLYALIKAAQSESIGWMLTGFFIAVIGGSSRQIVWVVPLAVLPYVAWIARKNIVFLSATIATWIATFILAAAIQRWFESQPYAIPDLSIRSEWIRASRDPATVVERFISVLITLALVTLPAGVTVFTRVRRSRQLAALTGLVLLAMARVTFVQRRFLVGPWMINILSTKGVIAGALIKGDRPQMLPWPIFPIISVVVFTVIAVLIASIALLLMNPIQTWQRIKPALCRPTHQQMATVGMLLVCIGYLALLLTRCTVDFNLFDRHLIMLIPCASVPLLRMGKSIPVMQWIVLALFGLYAIGSTQENLSAARARAIAVQRLRDAGVPRIYISGGFDYDAWTQLETTRYINDSRIKIPVGAYNPRLSRMPDLRPIYRVEYGPMEDSHASPFGTVSYFSLWPPFKRQVSIDRVTP